MTKATDAGFVEGKFYEIKDNTYVTSGNPVGSVLKLTSDDSSPNPYFENADGDTVVAYLTALDNVPRKGFNDKSPKKVTPASERGFVVGEKYMVKVGDDVRGFGDGALVEFVRDDGSDVLQFKSMLTSGTRYMELNQIVNLDGSELKEPEPVKTPAEIAGLKVGDKVIVTNSAGSFKVGEIMTFLEDDNSNIPYFTYKGERKAYYLSMVEKFDEDKPQIKQEDGKMIVTLYSSAAKVKFNAAFGIIQAYRITGNTSAHCFKTGDIVYEAEERADGVKGMTKVEGKTERDSAGLVKPEDYVAI